MSFPQIMRIIKIFFIQIISIYMKGQLLQLPFLLVDMR
ncbi:hypothetical protein N751_10215 [Legionella pneumophila str. Leg01/11]|nr:hypothetical protein N750_06590 [Legionella pneumophila str. Leg01/53]ERH45868.1 hypothetical protein N751_10215 [Legionella pneumophila str. Leg01/11]ERI49075.1 hypothetical protein N749_07080 [Legionella pneumophila str. Leg01/20]